jgi:hypothetical protein
MTWGFFVVHRSPVTSDEIQRILQQLALAIAVPMFFNRFSVYLVVVEGLDGA